MFLKVCSEDPLHQNPLGCWLKIQIPPRNLHSDPSSGDSDPQQSYRSTCNEGGGGAVWRGAAKSGVKCQGERGRSQVRGRW